MDCYLDNILHLCMFLIFELSPQSIIYFTVKSPKLLYWLKDESMQKALKPYTGWNHVEYDLAIFNINLDEDYIPCLQGITRASFCGVYLDWIQYCAKRETKVLSDINQLLYVYIFIHQCIHLYVSAVIYKYLPILFNYFKCVYFKLHWPMTDLCFRNTLQTI